MSAVIFSGNYVKTLKNGLNLAGNATIWSGNIDPSVSGFTAPIGDAYLSTLTGDLYLKQNSSDTAWSPASTVGGSWKTPVANFAALPGSGNSNGDIRVTLDNNKMYEYNGSTWLLVSDPNITPENSANKGQPNGYAPLDGASKVPYANLPSALMTYRGAWDPTTNTPTLANGTGLNGDVYRASVTGSSTSPIVDSWFAGDFIIYNGTIWQRSPLADGVISVNGNSGAVTVNAINQLTGDATAGPASGSQSQALTLATVNTNVGSFGTATQVPTLTINGKGLVTAASNTSIQIAESQVTNLVSDLAGKQAGPLTGDVTTSGAAATLATVNSNVGSFGSASSVGTFTVNGKGLVTAAGSSSIQIAESQVTNLVSDLAGKQATGNYITALTGDITATGPGSVASTLATVNTNVGSFGSASSVGSFTVNGKGLVTAASNTSIQIAESQVTNLVSDLAGKQAGPLTGDVTTSGTTATLATVNSNIGTFASATVNGKGLVTAAANLSGDATTSGSSLTLATVNSNVGSFGSNTGIPSFTVNGKGLITAASNNAVTTSPTASTISAWDANKNLSFNSGIPGYRTTATAAGTTTLVVGDAQQQYFTGTTTQTVVLPVTSTLVLGQTYLIVNNSTGNVTVQSSGGNTIQVMTQNTQLLVTVILTSGTTAASWNAQYTANLSAVIQPTIQKFTSGTSQTYTTPAGVQYIRVRMVGGGGGGSGSGTGSGNGNVGTASTASTFGTSLLTAGAGGGGTAGGAAGTGGTVTLNSPAIGSSFIGTQGSTGSYTNTSQGTGAAGSGGSSPFGGGGAGGVNAGSANAGSAAATNSGSGGGGGSVNNAASAAPGGNGGGSGGYIDAIITNPSATYTYTVGIGGSGGSAGTGGAAGGAGAAGYIEVTEFYTNYAISTTTSVAANTYFGGPTSGSAANPTFKSFQAPTQQRFTTGSNATYTLPSGVLYLKIRMVGGGGGGSGSGTAGATNGGGATDTLWKDSTGSTTILQASGANGGTFNGSGGSGGSATIFSPAYGTSQTGNGGMSFFESGVSSGLAASTPLGGASPFGGVAAGQPYNNAGGNAAANSGSGGNGGGNNLTVNADTGSAGGSGGYIEAYIASPTSTYKYTVGTKGNGGNAGTSGFAGGNGADGYIEVTEYYT